MKYFALFPIAKFEKDKYGGSIINLTTFERINYTKEESLIVSELLYQPISAEFEKSDIRYRIIKDLIGRGYGYLYDNRVYNDEYYENRNVEIRGLSEIPPVLHKVFLKITDNCNLQCLHCKQDSIINRGCFSCAKWKTSQAEHPSEKFWDVLERISKMFVEEYIISGGNPFFQWELLKTTISQIRRRTRNVKISITFNGTALDSDIICFLKEMKISLIFTILGCDSDSYEGATGVRGIFNEIDKNIDLVTEKGIDFSAVILAKGDEIEKIEAWLNKKEADILGVAEIYEKNKGFISVPSYAKRKEQINSKYRENERKNTCLNGILAIDSEGSLKPCPMINGSFEGEKDLDYLFQNKSIDKYWRMTKEAFDMCRDCTYKFTCSDCTAVELSIENKEIEGFVLCNRGDGNDRNPKCQ